MQNEEALVRNLIRVTCRSWYLFKITCLTRRCLSARPCHQRLLGYIPTQYINVSRLFASNILTFPSSTIIRDGARRQRLCRLRSKHLHPPPASLTNITHLVLLHARRRQKIHPRPLLILPIPRRVRRATIRYCRCLHPPDSPKHTLDP